MVAPNSGTAWDFIAYCPISTRSAIPQTTRSFIHSGIVKERTFTVPGRSTLIYPNPTSGDALLQLSSNRQAKIIISDITGKVLAKMDAIHKINVPFKKYNPGTYLITIIQNNVKETLKLIKL